MKWNIARITTTLAASSLLVGASVWAADDADSQSGQSSQSSQSSQSGQMGQSDAQMGKQSGMSESAGTELLRISQSPTEFVQHAYQDNLTEIQLGQLAQQKGQSQEVKDFGQHLVQGHQSLNDKLTQLASQKNITLSKQLDARHQKIIDSLQTLNGADFDKRFLREQVMNHRRDIGLYQRAAQNNTDPDVKSFAQTSLPALREHLQMAQQQAGTIDEAAGAGNSQQQGKDWSKDQYQKDQQGQGQSGQQDQQMQPQQQQPQQQQ